MVARSGRHFLQHITSFFCLSLFDQDGNGYPVCPLRPGIQLHVLSRPLRLSHVQKCPGTRTKQVIPRVQTQCCITFPARILQQACVPVHVGQREVCLCTL